MDRYLEKIDRRGPDECWPWTAARFDKGYGAFRLGQRQTKAHRFGYEMLVGPIPEGLYVCHTCDNPPCQNPAHWFLGTHKDNALDRVAKGRGVSAENLPSFVSLRGERNGATKLTDAQVDEVRALCASGLTQRVIAARFGISQANVSMIASGQTRKIPTSVTVIRRA